MKKVISITLIALCILLVLPNVSYKDVKAENSINYQEDISKKVIRFHVLANSDSVEDQNVKLKVRDKVLQYISPKLKNSKNINESREILKENDEAIKKIAQDVVKENGYSYSVKTELAYTNFPVKTYGNIVLPQGRYEAYRILIGKAEGHNWWCVMFPPLCFIDVTKGQVEEEKTQEAMKKVLTPEEYKIVNGEDVNNDNIVVKSKLLEEIKKIISKLNEDKTTNKKSETQKQIINSNAKEPTAFKYLLDSNKPEER